MVLEASLLTAVGVVGILRCQDASRWWLGPYRHLSCLPVDLMVTEQMVQISFKKLCLKKKKRSFALQFIWATTEVWLNAGSPSLNLWPRVTD